MLGTYSLMADAVDHREMSMYQSVTYPGSRNTTAVLLLGAAVHMYYRGRSISKAL